MKRLIVSIFLILVFVIGFIFFQNTKAPSGVVNISIFPAERPLSSDTPVQIWLTADKPVVFARITISFDPTKIALSSDPTLTGFKLTTQVTKTPLVAANDTGTFTFAVGLDPHERDNPPTGMFQVASMNFKSLSTAPNDQTTIRVTQSDADIVDNTAVRFQTTAEHFTVTLNP